MTLCRPPPLHIAAAKGFDEIVERLLQKDASTTIEGPDGQYPLEMASKAEIQEMIPKYQGDKVLKQYAAGSQDYVSDFHGKVVLTGALLLNDKEVFLSLNLSIGELAYYDNQEAFLEGKSPMSSIKLIHIYGVKECNPGIFSDKGHFFFIINTKSKPLKLYTEHDGLTAEWIKRIRQGIALALERKLGLEYSQERPRSRPGTPPEDERTPLRHSTTGLQNFDEDDIASPSLEPGTSREVVNFSSFAVLEELGSGSFGKVYKAIKNDTKRVYAIKCLSKQFLIKQKQLQYAISECKILRSLSHPFILHMHYAFQTPKNLYMVLDFCPNGDLLSHLQERLKFGESVCRFYCAEILLALEYLHSLDIVYRDLKPENILVDRAGHILMADFGLAKENVNSMNPAMSFCGSPAYLAPELLNKQGSEKSADVYSYGAILYEMLTGLPPFYSENIKELFKNIKNAQLQFPAAVRAEAKDLIKKVMNRDATKRPSISQLKRHPFFREIDWDTMLAKKVRPPRLGPSWKQVDLEVEGMVEVDYNAAPGLVIDEDYKEGGEDEELVDDFNY